MTEINENEEDSRRFQKPARLIDKVLNGQEGYLTTRFLPLQLDDIAEEIDYWLNLALVNDNSAYETGGAREDLMDFCSEFQLLAEALHVMGEAIKPADEDKWKEKLPEDLRERMGQLNQPQLLSKEQTINPMSVVDDFCNRFTLTYCRAELWDLLDAVITYDGEKEISKMNLLLVFDSISAMVEIAFLLGEKERANNKFINKKRP